MQLNEVWQQSCHKVVINNLSVTIEGNPILFNCSQGFTQNFGISQPSSILDAKNTRILEKKCVTTSPGLSYIKNIHRDNLRIKDNRFFGKAKEYFKANSKSEFTKLAELRVVIVQSFSYWCSLFVS